MENKKAKENFDIAINFLNENPPNKEKAREYFLKYLNCLSSEYDSTFC